MNICQLGKGYILSTSGSFFKVTYTGYPYPDLTLLDGATNQIENLGNYIVDLYIGVFGYKGERKYYGIEVRSVDKYSVDIHNYICNYILIIINI